jgi:hypothetical protein
MIEALRYAKHEGKREHVVRDGYQNLSAERIGKDYSLRPDFVQRALDYINERDTKKPGAMIRHHIADAMKQSTEKKKEKAINE